MSSESAIRVSVIECVDCITERITLSVDRGAINLVARRNPGIDREGRHQPRLFTFDAQVWQHRFTQQSRPFAEHLKAKLRLVVRVDALIRVVVLLHRARVHPRCKPVNHPAVRHCHCHDWIDGAPSVRSNSGDENASISVNQSGDVGGIFNRKSCDWISGPRSLARRLQSAVTSAIVSLFGGV